jgi:amino acid transporter
LSVGAVIGSGWLFAGLDAARRSGGGSVVAWLVAGGLVVTLALVHAELGTTFPVDGGTARFPLYAFGRVTGFLSGWFAWVATACIAPIETEAALRYAGNYVPWLTRLSQGSVLLAPAGMAVAALVLLGFATLNYFGLKGFSETNTVVVWFKIVIPVVVALALILHSFDTHNFVVGGSFFAGGFDGLLASISSGGVIFALIGFEQAVELGGESRHPQRNIPWAVIGSVVIGTAIYALLQLAFVGSMPASFLGQGWQNVHFQGIFGPYAGLASALGAIPIAFLVYAAALVSPSGTGLTYTATASRIPYALAREGYLPTPFGRVTFRHVPGVGLATSYLAGVAVIALFPDWDDILRFVTAAVVLVYALAPLSLAVLRRTAPDLPRPYRLHAPWLLSPGAFVIANLLLVWTGWDNLRIVLAVVALGVVLFLALAGTSRSFRHTGPEWRAAVWILPYLLGMAAVSVVSPYGDGLDAVPTWGIILLEIALSLAIYQLALALGTHVHRRLPAGERPIDRWSHTTALLESAEN